MSKEKKRRLGYGMKPRGVQVVSATEVQAEPAKEAVTEPPETVPGGYNLEPETQPGTLQNLESEGEPEPAASVALQDVLERSKEKEPERAKMPSRIMPAEEAKNYRPDLGEQPDGSFNVVLTVGEGYIEAIRQEAEAHGKTVKQWCDEQFNFFLQSWWQPPKAR